jgi:hypothetical protein
MERPATWKGLTLGAALTGLGVAGVGVAETQSGSPGSGPVSPVPLFNEEQLLASGGKGLCWNGVVLTACVKGPGWVNWRTPGKAFHSPWKCVKSPWKCGPW